MTFIDFDLFNLTDTAHKLTCETTTSPKKVLVIVYESDYTSKYTQSLESLIKAIKIDPATEVETLVLEKEQFINMGDWHRTINFDFCLNFGLDNKVISLNISNQHYVIRNFEQFQYMSSDTLHVMMEDGTLKKKLWEQLKVMFEV